MARRSDRIRSRAQCCRFLLRVDMMVGKNIISAKQSSFQPLYHCNYRSHTHSNTCHYGMDPLRYGLHPGAMANWCPRNDPKKANNLWAPTSHRSIVPSRLQPEQQKLGRDMMKLAESKDLIAIEQYGSRKNMSAIEHCLDKKLTFDVLRQQHSPGALCSNDAKGCYDWIAHSIAALCMH
jgi:hypothetical protein